MRQSVHPLEPGRRFDDWAYNNPQYSTGAIRRRVRLRYGVHGLAHILGSYSQELPCQFFCITIVKNLVTTVISALDEIAPWPIEAL